MKKMSPPLPHEENLVVNPGSWKLRIAQKYSKMTKFEKNSKKNRILDYSESLGIVQRKKYKTAKSLLT
jgi:hypothetical protein